MPNFASALKAEISRIARKDLRSDIDALRKQLSSQRASMMAMRRQLQALERDVKLVSKHRARGAIAGAGEAESGEESKIRFSAKGFAAHRQRLGISAADMAKLLGVSQLSVYKWESGKTRPRARQLASIAAVRKMGKRAVNKRLEELSANT